jgi:hypothetical protein
MVVIEDQEGNGIDGIVIVMLKVQHSKWVEMNGCQVLRQSVRSGRSRGFRVAKSLSER